jgi:hypothetical protein
MTSRRERRKASGFSGVISGVTTGNFNDAVSPAILPPQFPQNLVSAAFPLKVSETEDP